MPPADAEQTRWFLEEVQSHEAALRAYLRGSFPSLHDIDDLVQDAYVRLLRAHHAGQVEHPRAYLFTTARNAALDLFRRKQVVPMEALAEIERLSVLEERPDAAETISCEQEIEILTAAIDALPPRCAEILRMRRLRGMSHRAIAEALGISEHTVNAQLAIGLLRCRKFLRARGLVKGGDIGNHR